MTFMIIPNLIRHLKLHKNNKEIIIIEYIQKKRLKKYVIMSHIY